MKEKFKYFFDNETGILYKYYYGNITIEDIYSSWDYAITKGLIPKETKGFILDFTEAAMEIGLSNYHMISTYYKQHLDIFKNQKIAILTHSPKDIVIPTLVETEDDGYLSRPFYTLEAAIHWVLA